jgi:hypothetical protein
MYCSRPLKHLCTFDVAMALIVKSLRSRLAAVSQFDVAIIEAWNFDRETDVERSREEIKPVDPYEVRVISVFRRGTKTPDDCRLFRGSLKPPSATPEMRAKAPRDQRKKLNTISRDFLINN